MRGQNGSFGFAKGRLVCQAKPNVPFVRLAKIVFKMLVGKNKNTEALAFWVGYLLVHLSRPLYVYFCRSYSLCSLLGLQVTFCVLPQLAISEHYTVNLHKSLIGALSFNFARHR